MGTGWRLLYLNSVMAAGALAGCGERASDAPPFAEPGDPGSIHLHGLGVNPSDGSLFLATDTGLCRAPAARLRGRLDVARGIGGTHGERVMPARQDAPSD